MTAFILVLVLIAVPPGFVPLDARGNAIELGVEYPLSPDGVAPYTFSTLEKCNEAMALRYQRLRALHEDLEFVIGCRAAPVAGST